MNADLRDGSALLSSGRLTFPAVKEMHSLPSSEKKHLPDSNNPEIRRSVNFPGRQADFSVDLYAEHRSLEDPRVSALQQRGRKQSVPEASPRFPAVTAASGENASGPLRYQTGFLFLPWQGYCTPCPSRIFFCLSSTWGLFPV